jgi:hypothetical protein
MTRKQETIGPGRIAHRLTEQYRAIRIELARTAMPANDACEPAIPMAGHSTETAAFVT